MYFCDRTWRSFRTKFVRIGIEPRNQYASRLVKRACTFFGQLTSATPTCEMLRSSLSRIASRPSLLHCRPYVLSRFPDRKPVGTGRTKSPPSPQRTPQAPAPPEHADQYGSEGRPSAEESPLWEESRKIVGSDPEEGLMRLLLESNSLVVTR